MTGIGLELPRGGGGGHRRGARAAPVGRGGGAGPRARGGAGGLPHSHGHHRRGGRAPAMTLPDWLDPLYEAAEMRAVDAWAIEEQGVPSLDLMERAGIGLARLTASAAAGRPGGVRVVIGKGNNGGDGLAAARILREDGVPVDVLAVGDMADLKGDARANLERLPGEAPLPFELGMLDGSSAVVDALLGTGFSGEPREPVAGAIGAFNEQDAPVVACDVPSGVDASSGQAQGEAV